MWSSRTSAHLKILRHEAKPEKLVNFSIEVSGGKETPQNLRSNGERLGTDSAWESRLASLDL